MEISKIVAIALIAVIIILVLKQYKPEFAIYASIITGIIIFFMLVTKLEVIIQMLDTLSEKFGASNQFFIILLKITGIAYICEFGSSICKDSGEAAIASKVEMAGKILIIAMSIPIISALLETIINIIP